MAVGAQRIRIATVAALWFVAAAGAAAPPVQSIEEFLAHKSRWANYAAISLPLRVEGRVSAISASKGTLRFHGCDLAFHAEEGSKLPPLTRGCTNVEVAGRLQRSRGKLIFVVSSLRERPDDLQAFRLERVRLRPETAGDWYELADWARRRGRFYKDDELEQEAREACRQGILIERHHLEAGDWRALIALATKATAFGLPDALRQELVHEAYRVRWKSLQKETKPGFDRLLREMARDLPGCEKPLTDPASALQAKYATDPLAAYREAGAAARPKLHRMFHTEVVLSQIERQAKAGDLDGFEIAAEIDARLPERAALAEHHRERELARRLANVGRAGRDEMLALSALFEKRNEPGKARETIETWLEAEGTRLRRDGAAGLLQLADEHLRLLEDEPAAVALLKEAHALSPDTPEIATRLNRFGYVRRNGEWLTRDELKTLPRDPTEEAIRRGEVQVGMAPDQVRRALAGSPQSVARVASSGRINEVWIYEEPGGSKLTVHFLRSARQPREESKVVAVCEVRVPAADE